MVRYAMMKMLLRQFFSFFFDNGIFCLCGDAVLKSGKIFTRSFSSFIGYKCKIDLLRIASDGNFNISKGLKVLLNFEIRA